MKNSVTEYLKLIMRYLKVDTFEDITDYNYRHQTEFKFESKRKFLLQKYISSRYKKDEPIVPLIYSLYYNGFFITYRTVTKNLEFRMHQFQKGSITVDIPLDIDSKDEFFNFALENNIGYLKLEDLDILREIVEIIKITTKSGGYSDKLYANQNN
ncbi:hypothetical protein XaC1_461 [Xanthomonas phage XaC1]|nr:hypothetical protein XaC1_461 [Xanthomonas phage XaC1]